MEEKTPFLKTKEGELVRFKGIPTLDPKDESLAVQGAMGTTGTLEDSTVFGESGEVFNHRVWRVVIVALWSLPSVHPKLLSLATYMFMRGKSAKIDNKGKCVTYNLPLPNDMPENVQKALGGATGTYPLKINFPQATSKVPGYALTPERFKCILRVVLVPELMKAERFPAVTESIGYGEMARSLMIRCKAYSEDKSEQPEYATDVEIWKSFDTFNPASHISATSCVAGCFSSKEIYQDDDEMFPGCIWWSGVHAMMTDVVNKLRASTVSADVRARYEHSNFYGDFKRKLIARGIMATNSKEYEHFLGLMQNIIVRFIRAGTGMSEREAAVMDAIMENAIKTSKETRPTTSVETLASTKIEFRPVSGSTAKTARESHELFMNELLSTTTSPTRTPKASASK